MHFFCLQMETLHFAYISHFSNIDTKSDLGFLKCYSQIKMKETQDYQDYSRKEDITTLNP